MRPLAYSVILLLLGAINLQANAPLVALDKVIEKEFNISNDGTLNVENRYGNITVTEGNSGKIKIKITIDVKTSSESKAEEIFDRIDIDFSNTSNYVSAVTDIEEEKGWSSWFSWGSDTDFKIHYEISMPASVHLKLTHRYGDVYLPDLNNGLDMVMKYGNVVMNSVEGTINLDLGYSKLDFGDLGEVIADVKYSRLNGSSTQEFKINSKYSQYKIGDVAKLRNDSKYDNYDIDQVGEVRNSGKYDTWLIGKAKYFKADTKYSPIEIESLEGDLKISQKYGSVIIDKVACEKGDINLDVEYTDVELGLGNCGVDMDFEGEYVGLKLPGDMRDQVNKNSEDAWLRGKFGNGEKKVSVRMEHGSLKIW
ncbi:hypothetical protein [Portibacter marinus]|uniref:hypothetical protein n=1 Tax=Portibacter marinus TaxID=2898660 RepID=UPI001F216CE5|nr:hypothetical protein [Portibacter marinus]